MIHRAISLLLLAAGLLLVALHLDASREYAAAAPLVPLQRTRAKDSVDIKRTRRRRRLHESNVTTVAADEINTLAEEIELGVSVSFQDTCTSYALYAWLGNRLDVIRVFRLDLALTLFFSLAHSYRSDHYFHSRSVDVGNSV